MSEAITRRIETGVDAGAAAVYAAMTAFVLLQVDATGPYAGVGATAAFAGALYGLLSIQPEARSFAIAGFQPSAFETVELEELVLTDADRLRPCEAEEEDALVLDDILAKVEPESRVVRLFDPSAMPTAGQLKARIDRHLDRDSPLSASPDASQALFDALADLKRSLR